MEEVEELLMKTLHIADGTEVSVLPSPVCHTSTFHTHTHTHKHLSAVKGRISL